MPDSSNLIRLTKHIFSEDSLAAVVEVLRSGDLVQGRHVLNFEAALRDYLKAEHVVLVSSGTAALHLALLALNIGAEAEVIVPAFTFPATANVVEIVGAKPIFVDINLSDFCIDTSALGQRLSSKTRCIIPVHEFGMPCNLAELQKAILSTDIAVVEDAACAFGAEFEGRKVGNFGTIGCFSLHPRKALTTGEGGILTTGSSELAERLRLLRNHGMLVKNNTREFLLAGLNYRLTEFQAVLGQGQLDEYSNEISHREKIAKLYDQELQSIPWIRTPERFPERRSIYQSYHILLDQSIDRDQVVASLRESGIETGPGAQALACLAFFQKRYNLKPSDFPNALRSYSHGIVLPIGRHLTTDQALYIVDRLNRLGK